MNTLLVFCVDNNLPWRPIFLGGLYNYELYIIFSKFLKSPWAPCRAPKAIGALLKTNYKTHQVMGALQGAQGLSRNLRYVRLMETIYPALFLRRLARRLEIYERPHLFRVSRITSGK